MLHVIITSVLFLFFLLNLPDKLEASEKLSNGLIEIVVNTEKGTDDVFDIKKNQMVIQNSKIAFSVAEYFDLGELVDNQIETNAKVTYINSS